MRINLSIHIATLPIVRKKKKDKKIEPILRSPAAVRQTNFASMNNCWAHVRVRAANKFKNWQRKEFSVGKFDLIGFVCVVRART